MASAFEKDFPNTAKVLNEIFSSAGSIKLALADTHLSVDEIVESIPDDNIKQGIRDQLVALKALPGEFNKLVHDPFKLMTEAMPFIVASATAGVFK